MKHQVCYQPLGPMEVGGMCPACSHPAPAHSNGGPCVMCWTESQMARIKDLAQRIEDAAEAQR